MNRRFKALPACISQTQRDNLWRKVERGAPNECWLWAASTGASGYPRIWINNIDYCATRIAYLDFYGLQPGSQMVCHSCDTPMCMNPNHFFLGSHDDNMADRQSKGRQYKGASHHRAKFTEQQVLEVFALKGHESSTSIAKRLGVSKSSIKAIWQGRNWSHLTGKVCQCA